MDAELTCYAQASRCKHEDLIPIIKTLHVFGLIGVDVLGT